MVVLVIFFNNLEMNILIFLSVVLQFKSVFSNLIELSPNQFIVVNHYNHLSSSKNNLDENKFKIKEKYMNPSILKQNYQIKTQEFNFLDTFQSYEVIYSNSSFIWILAIDHNKKIIFYSYDNGVSFVLYNKIDSIDRIYVNNFNSDMVIFSNTEKNQIYLSKNNGKNLSLKTLNFRPDFITFLQNEAILITEENSGLFKAWISFDFGNRWISIGENLSHMPQWKITNQNGYLYWIGNDHGLKKLDLNILKEKKILTSQLINEENSQADGLKITENFVFLTIKNVKLYLCLFLK